MTADDTALAAMAAEQVDSDISWTADQEHREALIESWEAADQRCNEPVADDVAA